MWREGQREKDIQGAVTEKKPTRPEAERQVPRKEYNDIQMWNFIVISPLSKLTIPLAVPKIKDHF